MYLLLLLLFDGARYVLIPNPQHPSLLPYFHLKLQVRGMYETYSDSSFSSSFRDESERSRYAHPPDPPLFPLNFVASHYSPESAAAHLGSRIWIFSVPCHYSFDVTQSITIIHSAFVPLEDLLLCLFCAVIGRLDMPSLKSRPEAVSAVQFPLCRLAC